MHLGRRPFSVLFAALTLLVASLSGCGSDNSSNTGGTAEQGEPSATDQAIADDAVLKEGDLPEWTASPPDDDETDDDEFETPAECQAIEEEFGELDDLFGSDVDDAANATSPDFEFESETSVRFLSNEVSVGPDTEEADMFFDIMQSDDIAACLESVFAEEMTNDDEPMTVSGLEIDIADIGDRAAVFSMTVSTEVDGMPFEMAFVILFVQVDRAGSMFTFGGVDVSPAGLEAPAVDVLVEELKQTGALDLVIERLEDALA